MAVFSNQNKNTTTITNQSKASDSNKTWDESVSSWDKQGQSTWDLILAVYTKVNKNITSFVNQSKN